MALVDAAGYFRVAPSAEYGRGSSVRVDASEIFRRQREAPVRVVDRLKVVQEEGALSLLESPFLAAEYECAELESGESTSGKNGGKSVPRRRFSKSNSPATRPLVETDLKNLAAVRSA